MVHLTCHPGRREVRNRGWLRGWTGLWVRYSVFWDIQHGQESGEPLPELSQASALRRDTPGSWSDHRANRVL